MSYLHNVYIFNKIKNNEADIDLLTNTFESLACVVKIINNVPLVDLKNEVARMYASDFERYKYVVVIILDNTNKDKYIWKSLDEMDFYLDGDLMNTLKANVTLGNKLVLSIFQNNNIISDKIKIGNKSLKRNYILKEDARIYAVSYGKKLGHQWQSNCTSTFIRVLCEQLKESETNHKSIEEILSLVACNVFHETRSEELPVKDVNQTRNINSTRLGRATNEIHGG